MNTYNGPTEQAILKTVKLFIGKPDRVSLASPTVYNGSTYASDGHKAMYIPNQVPGLATMCDEYKIGGTMQSCFRYRDDYKTVNFSPKFFKRDQCKKNIESAYTVRGEEVKTKRYPYIWVTDSELVIESNETKRPDNCKIQLNYKYFLDAINFDRKCTWELKWAYKDMQVLLIPNNGSGVQFCIMPMRF